MNERAIKILGSVVMLIVVINLILFAFRVIDGTIFWAVIVFGAVFTYVVLPKLKKNDYLM